MVNLQFNHPACGLRENLSLVYTALSKHLFYYRMHISKFVLEQSKVPFNPFLLFDYILIDSVGMDIIRKSDNSLLLRSDEV